MLCDDGRFDLLRAMNDPDEWAGAHDIIHAIERPDEPGRPCHTRLQSCVLHIASDNAIHHDNIYRRRESRNPTQREKQDISYLRNDIS